MVPSKKRRHCGIKPVNESLDETEDYQDLSFFDEPYSSEDSDAITIIPTIPTTKEETCEEKYPDIYEYCDSMPVLCAPKNSKCGAETDGINECRCPFSKGEKWVIRFIWT